VLYDKVVIYFGERHRSIEISQTSPAEMPDVLAIIDVLKQRGHKIHIVHFITETVDRLDEAIAKMAEPVV